MIKSITATIVAFVLLVGVAAGSANAAPTYGFSVGAEMTNPFQAEDR